MAKFVRRITVIESDGNRSQSQVIYKSKKKKRKVSRWAKPLERAQRRLLKAESAYTREALGRHHRSNRKRKNGFARDAGINQMRASRKFLKKLRKGL